MTDVRERTWASFYSGLIWLVLGFGLIFLSEVLTLIVWVAVGMWSGGPPPLPEDMAMIVGDGDFLGLAFLVALPVVAGAIALVIRYRRKRAFGEYIGLRPVSIRVVGLFLLLAFALMIVEYPFGIFFDRPDVHDWAEIAFMTTDYRLLLFLGIVVIAPVMEELLYRGYVLQAWVESKLPEVAAVVLLSALWSLTHFQYDLYDRFWVFVLGVLLAYARIRSGSIYPPLAIHFAWNLSAYLYMDWYLSR